MQPQKPAFCQHASLALDHIPKISRKLRVGNHHRLTEHGAHLGAAYVEHIAQPGQILQGHITVLRRQAVAQPGPVQEQIQAILPADPVQRLQFLPGIQGSQLRGIGDIDHFGLHLMGRVLLALVAFHQLLHLSRRNLAVPGGQGQHLVPRSLHSAGFVDMDMATLGRYHSLVGPQGCGNHRQIGLGTPHQKVHRQILPAAQPPDGIRSLSAQFVLSVAGEVSLGKPVKPPENLRMAAGMIIVLKIEQTLRPLCILSLSYRFSPHLSRTPGKYPLAICTISSHILPGDFIIFPWQNTAGRGNHGRYD